MVQRRGGSSFKNVPLYKSWARVPWGSAGLCTRTVRPPGSVTCLGISVAGLSAKNLLVRQARLPGLPSASLPLALAARLGGSYQRKPPAQNVLLLSPWPLPAPPSSGREPQAPTPGCAGGGGLKGSHCQSPCHSHVPTGQGAQQ